MAHGARQRPGQPGRALCPCGRPSSTLAVGQPTGGSGPSPGSVGISGSTCDSTTACVPAGKLAVPVTVCTVLGTGGAVGSVGTRV